MQLVRHGLGVAIIPKPLTSECANKICIKKLIANTSDGKSGSY